jgi:hypothetical protein
MRAMGLGYPTHRVTWRAASRALWVVGSLRDVVMQSLVTEDVRPSTRRQSLVSLGPFLDLDPETLAVADVNEILLGIVNQNIRRK